MNFEIKFYESLRISIYASLREMKRAINIVFLAYKTNECFNHQYIYFKRPIH